MAQIYFKPYLHAQVPREWTQSQREQPAQQEEENLDYLDHTFRQHVNNPRFGNSPLENPEYRDRMTQEGLNRGLAGFDPRALSFTNGKAYGNSAAFQPGRNGAIMNKSFNGGIFQPAYGMGLYGGRGALGFHEVVPTEEYWKEYPYENRETDMYRFWEDLYGN